MKHILLTILIAVILVGCADSTAPERYSKDQYHFITGTLMAGEPVDLNNPILIGKTLQPDNLDFLNMIETDAQAVIIDLSDSTVYPLIPDFDDELGFGYVNENLIPEAGKSYKIFVGITDSILVNGVLTEQVVDSLWATTTIPNPLSIREDEAFTADTLETGWTNLKWETANQEHPIHLIFDESADGENVPIKLELYCLEHFTNAYYTDDTFYDEEKPEEEEDYEDPQSGYPRKSGFFVEVQPELEDDSNEVVVSLRSYKDNLIFFGRYQIKVNTIDENYYSYLYKPEGYTKGGVHGGFGYFGSGGGEIVYTKVIK
jgi:hypothetical protein